MEYRNLTHDALAEMITAEWRRYLTCTQLQQPYLVINAGFRGFAIYICEALSSSSLNTENFLGLNERQFPVNFQGTKIDMDHAIEQAFDCILDLYTNWAICERERDRKRHDDLMSLNPPRIVII